MSVEPETLPTWWYWLAGLGGAVVSVAHLKNFTVWQKLGAILAGTFTAGFVGPAVAEYWRLTPHMMAAANFLIGLGGLTITGGLLSFIQYARNNPLKLVSIRDFLTEWINRSNGKTGKGDGNG